MIMATQDWDGCNAGLAPQRQIRTICHGLGLTHGFGKVDIVQKVLNSRACFALEPNELSSDASTGSSCGTMSRRSI